MGFLNSKPAQQEKAVTSGDLANKLQQAMDRNTKALNVQKEQALSSFSQTVASLRLVNEMLRQDVAVANEMIDTCQNRKAEAEQQIKENEAICSHILEIIGEPIPGVTDKDENLQ